MTGFKGSAAGKPVAGKMAPAVVLQKIRTNELFHKLIGFSRRFCFFE